MFRGHYNAQALIKTLLPEWRDQPVPWEILPWGGVTELSLSQTHISHKSELPRTRRLCPQLCVGTVLGCAGCFPEPFLRVTAVCGTVLAGQPLSAAAGRALHWHGSQRAAPSLVSTNPGTGPPHWERGGKPKGDV